MVMGPVSYTHLVATLRLLGLQRTMTLLDRLASITGRQRRSMPSSRDAEFEKAALIARGVDVAARYGFCLLYTSRCV